MYFGTCPQFSLLCKIIKLHFGRKAKRSFLYIAFRSSFSFAGRWNYIKSHLVFSMWPADQLIVSPPFCGSNPYPCGSLTYRICHYILHCINIIFLKILFVNIIFWFFIWFLPNNIVKIDIFSMHTLLCINKKRLIVFIFC